MTRFEKRHDLVFVLSRNLSENRSTLFGLRSRVNPMIDLKILRRAVLLGVGFELALVAGGYFGPVRSRGCCSAACWWRPWRGMFYARDLGRGFGSGALGGALAGAACGVAAVVAASFLNERPETHIPYGVMVLMFTGAVGGVFGEFDVRLRACIIRKLTH